MNSSTLAIIARERLTLYGECPGNGGERERRGGSKIDTSATSREPARRLLEQLDTEHFKSTAASHNYRAATFQRPDTLHTTPLLHA
jgi:hypothetical protein